MPRPNIIGRQPELLPNPVAEVVALGDYEALLVFERLQTEGFDEQSALDRARRIHETDAHERGAVIRRLSVEVTAAYVRFNRTA